MKYHNIKTEADGYIFDSRKEARRWNELKLWERCGGIENLRRQVRYTLINGQRWRDGKKHRDTTYVADFVYTISDTGELVVEDVKGVRTQAYKIKRELMKQIYDIEIKEV